MKFEGKAISYIYLIEITYSDHTLFSPIQSDFIYLLEFRNYFVVSCVSEDKANKQFETVLRVISMCAFCGFAGHWSVNHEPFHLKTRINNCFMYIKSIEPLKKSNVRMLY